MSVMSNLNIIIRERLIQGYSVKMVAKMLCVPVEWVQCVDNEMITTLPSFVVV